MKQTVPSSPGRIVMKFICTLLGIILALMLAATAVFQHLFGNMNYVNQSKTPAELLQLLQDGGSAQPDPEGSGGGPISRDSDIVNILLIGQDRRENEARTRSDTMILCTFNKNTKQITLTSFLRDLYVPIPGYGSNRLNSAYAFGGMELLDNTLAQNFDIRIDGNVEVDFSQFAQIVNTLGGVEMDIRQDEAEFINFETGSEISAGRHRLDGFQALAYARIRKLDADGDFSRTSRQRRLLDALLEAYRSASLPVMLSLTTQVMPMLTTDIPALKIVGYAMELFPMLSNAEIVSQRIPANNTFSDQYVDGMSVLVPDLDANRRFLRDTLSPG